MAFRYKRRKYLENTDDTLNQISALSQLQCTQKEAAAVLGVSARTFEYFLAECEEARDAWRDGKQVGRVSLRRLLWKQAQTDEAQARFLAKDERWLNMEDKSTVAQTTSVVTALTVDDRLKRVLELQDRVLKLPPMIDVTPAKEPSK